MPAGICWHCNGNHDTSDCPTRNMICGECGRYHEQGKTCADAAAAAPSPGPRVVVVSVDDGWHATYIDGKLMESSDNDTAHDLVRILEQQGVIAPGVVAFETATSEVDQEISDSGVFPDELPDTHETKRRRT